MGMNLGDSQEYISHTEDSVESGQPEPEVVSQTQSSTTTDPTVGTVRPAPEATYIAPAPAANQSTVQTTTTAERPGAQVYNRTVSDQVVNPAANRAAAVDWVSGLVWFVIGVLAVLVAIRFVLL